MTSDFLPYLCILPALAYQALSLAATRAFFARECPAAAVLPKVSIIKPLKGLDAGSRENLESFCRQNYPEFQIIFALQSAADSALPVVRQLMADFPQLDLELVIDPALHGVNGKVSNLMNAYPLVKHDLVVIADSDIRVEADYLEKIAVFFADPEVGLVTSLYRGGKVHGAAAAVEALGFSVEMVPNVIVAERLEGLSFALGASMAVRRQALESIGGFAPLADYLADDYQLGNMIHRAGWKVALSADFVESVTQRESLAAVLARQLRWSRTLRVSRPWGYLASGVTQPFLALVLSLVMAGFSPALFYAALLLYLLRGAMVTYGSRAFVKDNLLPGYLWLLPFRDALSTAAWLLAFTGNRVKWRGEVYQLKTDGKMLRLD